MMKLSHESKVRLGVGIGAFVLIIGLVFGISRTLIHFDGPWDLDDVVSGFSGMDDAVDEDDLLDGGNYSAQPQQLSSETFDADAFTSLDLDVTSGTVEVKHVSSGPVRVIESGRVATGTVAFDAATQNLAEIKGSTLKIRQFDCDDERAIDRTVTVELPREVADNMVGITANVGSGDLTVAGIAYDERHAHLANANGDGRITTAAEATDEVRERLYATGWAKRGPVGLIGSTKSDALLIVTNMLEDLSKAAEGGRVAADRDPESIDRLLESRGVKPIDFAGWKKIDAFERAEGAKEGREHKKVIDPEQMRALAHA